MTAAGLALTAAALVLGAFDGGSAVAPLEVDRRVTPEQVKLGEPFVHRIAITHPPGQRYELERPQELGPFEIFDVRRTRVDAPPGQQGPSVTTFEVRMALFELGVHPLPAFPFTVVDLAGTHRWTSEGAQVEAVPTLGADAEAQGAALRDIKPPVDVPIRSYRLLWALLIAVAVAALAYLAFAWWRRRQAAPAPAPAPVPLGDRARSALDALAAEQLPEKGRVKEFYFRLSEIVRGYLGERYSFEALECTTPELIDALRRRKPAALPLDEVAGFSNEADLVKFARAPATAEQCQQAMQLAYRILESTWPPPPPAVPSTSTPPRAPHGPGPVVP